MILVNVLSAAFVILSVVSAQSDFYKDGIFYREYSGLTEIPDDIPDEAVEVHLDNNQITKLRTNAFANLASCTLLRMYYNLITQVEFGAFNGLQSLQMIGLAHNRLTELNSEMLKGLENLDELRVHENQITIIHEGTFKNLKRLKTLLLAYNDLTELRADMFIGLDFLQVLTLSGNKLSVINSNILAGLPRPLNLAMSATFLPITMDNPLQCDNQLCWLKHEEEAGTVTWLLYRSRNYKPKCANEIEWDTWTCNVQSVCDEPGGVAYSTRSGTFWPYTINSKVTYTCNTGYTGGGIMICQSDGQWTERSNCTTISTSTTKQSLGLMETILFAIIGGVVCAFILGFVVGLCVRRKNLQGSEEKSDKGNSEKSDEIGVNRLNVISKTGFVNRASEEDTGYTKLQKRPDCYLEATGIQPTAGSINPSASSIHIS